MLQCSKSARRMLIRQFGSQECKFQTCFLENLDFQSFFYNACFVPFKLSEMANRISMMVMFCKSLFCNFDLCLNINNDFLIARLRFRMDYIEELI